MKQFIKSLLIDIEDDLYRKIRKERLSISERIAIETSLVRLRIIRNLMDKFTVS
jgi:hypothetical protein